MIHIQYEVRFHDEDLYFIFRFLKLTEKIIVLFKQSKQSVFMINISQIVVYISLTYFIPVNITYLSRVDTKPNTIISTQYNKYMIPLILTTPSIIIKNVIRVFE